MPLEMKNDSGVTVGVDLKMRSDDGTVWWNVELFQRNDTNDGWVKIWPITSGITVTPGSSVQGFASGAAVSQDFAVSGGTGTPTWDWAADGAGLTILNPNSTTCTVQAPGQTSGSRSGTLRCTRDGFTDTAFIEWTWGTQL